VQNVATQIESEIAMNVKEKSWLSVVLTSFV